MSVNTHTHPRTHTHTHTHARARAPISQIPTDHAWGNSGVGTYIHTLSLSFSHTHLFQENPPVMREATVVSVDRTLQPPTYLVKVGESDRETERSRLFVNKPAPDAL